VAKNLKFNYHGIEQNLDVTFDGTMVDIMADYPFIHEYCYLETPLSPTLRESLLPQLEQYLAPLDQQQQLELLASFTRSAFDYKDDNDNFGRTPGPGSPATDYGQTRRRGYGWPGYRDGGLPRC